MINISKQEAIVSESGLDDATIVPKVNGLPRRSSRSRILDMFDEAKRQDRPLNVSAPMVRYDRRLSRAPSLRAGLTRYSSYSKLPFRLLARHYNTDITYTPMILAHEFTRSHIARDSDFTTCSEERELTPDGRQHALIAQFASSDPTEFARAADLIAPWVDGVDLNCGCPQSWAIKEGIGCALSETPGNVANMVRAAKERLDRSKSVSVKIRISKNLGQTRRWIEVVQAAGVDFITVHGRTRSQRSSTPPDFEAIQILKEFAKVPIVANGDTYSEVGVKEIAQRTGVDGVMAARGILENPALFAGFDVTPVECVQKFMELAIRHPIPFPLILHHVGEMTGHMPGLGKGERRKLMDCQDLLDLIDFVEAQQGLGRKIHSKPNGIQ